MSKNFWSKLSKPIFTLAPMANVTDFVFRELFARHGGPDVMWTEFVSADGLVSKGKSKLVRDLKFSPKQRPIVAQLFSGKAETMKKAATLVEKLGFDGLDINMGCPDKAVEKQGGGASLIKKPKLALEILEAAREGAPNIPVSIKTRIGYSKNEIEEWIGLLLAQKPPALTVHLRTRKEMSLVPAHWELMPLIVKMRNEISPETLIIGNGDVMSVRDGLEKVQKYGCDGVMIGRGIFGKPWFFENIAELKGFDPTEIVEEEKTPEYRMNEMLKHVALFEKTFGKTKNFDTMKKHLKAYVSGWDGAKELRIKLMEAKNAKEVRKIVKDLEA